MLPAPAGSPEPTPVANVELHRLDLATGGSMTSTDGRVRLDVAAGSGDGMLWVGVEPATVAGTESLVLNGHGYAVRVLDANAAQVVSLPVGWVLTYVPSAEELAAVSGDVSLLQVLAYNPETGGLEAVASTPSEDWLALHAALIALSAPPAPGQQPVVASEPAAESLAVAEAGAAVALTDPIAIAE
jgi:hypothetical protein